MVFDLKDKIFHRISSVLTKHKIEAFVIGGFVRDLILERKSKDIDIVTTADGILLAKLIADDLGTYPNLFKNFGTAQIKFENYEIEIVGARKESYRENSRKPTVVKGTLQDDFNRRDFTINSLAISLNVGIFGKLIDPFGGLNDIKNKILKTPLAPDKTFSDDPLRMMRAIRFASQLGFKIDENAMQSIKRNAYRLQIISKERICDELNKILLSKKPSIGLALLDAVNLYSEFLPEIPALKGVETINGFSHKDNYWHTLEVVDNIAKVSDNLWLRWTALMHDIAKPRCKRFDKKIGWTFHSHDYIGSKMINKIFNRLKLPKNEKMQYVKKLVSLHLRPIALINDVTDSAVRRLIFEAGDDIDDLMTLCEADITSKNETKVKQYLQNLQNLRAKIKIIEEKDRIRNWKNPITGNVIMENLNIEPSKKIAEIKEDIKNAILDGKIANNYEEAFQYMMKNFA